MLDIIGDPARHVLEYLDLDSLVAVTEVNQSWLNTIVQHHKLWFQRQYQRLYNHWPSCQHYVVSIPRPNISSKWTVLHAASDVPHIVHTVLA